MLKITKLEVNYGDMRALKGVSLDVEEGQLMAVLGSNGAGKTTLLKTISGIIKPDIGEIFFQGRKINKIPPYEIAKLGIAHVPEGRRMFSNLSVMENLEIGSYIPEAKKERAKLLEQVLKIFPRLKERTKQKAGSLSGGEQQMLVIGRALMQKPKLIMFDEPSLGLSPLMVEQVFEYIAQIHKEGQTILLVEQNAYACLGIAESGCVLENGYLTMSGRKEDLLSSEYVKEAYLGI